MSITELPVEILGKILSTVGKADLYNICHEPAFREAVHHLAVVNIRKLITKNIMEPKNLSRIGWKDGAHDHETCSCTDIAFRYKPFGSDFQEARKREEWEEIGEEHGIETSRKNFIGLKSRFFEARGRVDGLAISEDGIFIGLVDDERDERGPKCKNLIAISRKGRVETDDCLYDEDDVDAMKVLPQYDCLNIYVQGNTLVTLTETLNSPEEDSDSDDFGIDLSDPNTFSNFKVTIYDAGSFELRYELDLLKSLPDGFPRYGHAIHHLAITKTMLAVHVVHNWSNKPVDQTLLFKIDADKPELEAEYLHTVTSCLEKVKTALTKAVRSSDRVCLNDEYLLILYKSYYIGEENSRVAIGIHRINELQKEPEYLEIKHAPVDNQDFTKKTTKSLQLENGSSPYLVSWEPIKPSLILINLETKQKLLDIHLDGFHIPCQWYGGVFTFIKINQEEEEIGVRILDPRIHTKPIASNEDLKEGSGSTVFFPGFRATVYDDDLGEIIDDYKKVGESKQSFDWYLDYKGLVLYCWAEQDTLMLCQLQASAVV